MSQVPYLRGLRGLGADSRDCGIPGPAATVSDEECRAAAAAGDAGAQEEVTRANEQAADLFTRGGDTTNLTFGPMATRPGRVSPLSVSWNMPLQVQPIQSRTAAPRGISGMSLGLAAGVVVVVGASLYLIFKD